MNMSQKASVSEAAPSLAGGLRRRSARTFAASALALCLALTAHAGTALAAGAPTIVSEQATAGTISATAEAQIDTGGAATTCEVQYVSEQDFEASGWQGAKTQACPAKIGAAAPLRWTFVHLSGLTIATTYEYRFIATNSVDTTPGPEAKLVTFGLQSFGFDALEPPSLGPTGEPLPGASFTRAGGHPYELVTSFVVNRNTGTYVLEGRGQREFNSVATLKDVKVQLPVGLIGNPAAIGTCSLHQAESHECGSEDQIGMMAIKTNEINGKAGVEETNPLFNIVPPRGVAARFSAKFNGFVNAIIDARVRAGSDYGIDAESLDITSLGSPSSVVVRMWGVPASPSHDAERVCTPASDKFSYEMGCAFGGREIPFLTMPTSCTGPGGAVGEVDAFQTPGDYATYSQQMPSVAECEALGFAPSLEAQPTTTSTDSPTGMKVDLHVPQEEAPEGVASSDLKDATVTFPAGVTVDPSSANGLGVCPEGAEGIGFTGFAELSPQGEPGVKSAQFTEGPALCPDASKIGTVLVHTPLVKHPLPGAMYLAEQGNNPFGSLLAVYLTVYDPITGVVIKLPGLVQANSETGQLTVTFDQNPQLPFEDLEVELFGAKEDPAHSRAPLSTPQTCGSYSTSSVLTPWDGNAAVSTSSHPFELTEGPEGEACVGSEAQAPNSPGFEAGTASPVGGSYSPFVLKLTREDGSQRFHALDVTLPPGLTGKVAGVQECPDADIEAARHRSQEGEGALEQAHPSCPAGSEVGVMHVGVGSGAPYYVNGHAYFAGPFDGAPFSLVFVTPAVAGPFDLGTVVVRAALFIDPVSAQVSVKSEPFPTILDGIPLDIRSVGVSIDRPEFVLNPTSCDAMSVGGQETSTAGQAVSLSDRFQAGGCDTMPFKPAFSASTNANHTRKGGAELDVRLQTGGGEANIGKVHVTLPMQLPAELSTLKLACTEAQFAANPAGCPPGSFVGAAIAHTPLLPVPLAGSAIFVSHGGAGFPNLDLVLQGDGVTITLVGETLISKVKGNEITTSTFPTIPDVPVGSFELQLPAGEHPALGGNGNFCVKPLYMPTRIVGQNGGLVEQKTKIAVHGCKPEMKVLGHSVHGTHARIRVRVPSAGRLVASGKGIQQVGKKATKARTITIEVSLNKHDRRVLAANPKQRVNTKVQLKFTPTHGASLTTHVKLLLRWA